MNIQYPSPGLSPPAFSRSALSRFHLFFSEAVCIRGVRSQRAASRLSRRFFLPGHWVSIGVSTRHARVRAPLASGDFQSQTDSTGFQPVVVEWLRRVRPVI